MASLRSQNKLVEIKKAGNFPWQDYVFREADFSAYKTAVPKKTKVGKPAKVDATAYK